MFELDLIDVFLVLRVCFVDMLNCKKLLQFTLKLKAFN